MGTRLTPEPGIIQQIKSSTRETSVLTVRTYAQPFSSDNANAGRENDFMSFSLEKLKNLRSLTFTQDCRLIDLDKSMFANFCMALSKCHSLKILDLSNHALGGLTSRNFEALRNVLPQLTELQRLSLGDNELDAWGSGDGYQFSIFCDVLSRCHNLQMLSLRNNNLDESIGVERPLCFVLPRCHALQRLDLSGNGLGSNGIDIEALCKALSNCHNLQELDLTDNPLKDEQRRQLHRVMEARQRQFTLEHQKTIAFLYGWYTFQNKREWQTPTAYSKAVFGGLLGYLPSELIKEIWYDTGYMLRPPVNTANDAVGLLFQREFQRKYDAHFAGYMRTPMGDIKLGSKPLKFKF